MGSAECFVGEAPDDNKKLLSIIQGVSPFVLDEHSRDFWWAASGENNIPIFLGLARFAVLSTSQCTKPFVDKALLPNFVIRNDKGSVIEIGLSGRSLSGIPEKKPNLLRPFEVKSAFFVHKIDWGQPRALGGRKMFVGLFNLFPDRIGGFFGILGGVPGGDSSPDSYRNGNDHANARYSVKEKGQFIVPAALVIGGLFIAVVAIYRYIYAGGIGVSFAFTACAFVVGDLLILVGLIWPLIREIFPA